MDKVKDLKAKISQVQDKLIAIEQPVEKRLYLLCESQDSYDVSKFLFNDLGCRFAIATGIDSDNCFEILYHFAYDKLGCVITVKAFIRDKENPSIESLTPILPAAEWIEREIHDVLGIDFKNHPNLKRLILADNWPEGVYPSRKEKKK